MKYTVDIKHTKEARIQYRNNNMHFTLNYSAKICPPECCHTSKGSPGSEYEIEGIPIICNWIGMYLLPLNSNYTPKDNASVLRDNRVHFFKLLFKNSQKNSSNLFFFFVRFLSRRGSAII